MRNITDATLADLFADHVRVLLSDPRLEPRVKIEAVVAATRELAASVILKRVEGRPLNTTREKEMANDPFVVPLMALARELQREGLKALALPSDPAEQAVQDLWDGKVIHGEGD